MKNPHIETDRWYIGIPTGSNQEMPVYVMSNSRSEGPKGYYATPGNTVGYGTLAINPFREPTCDVDDESLFQANYAFSRVNNDWCKAIAAKYFKELSEKQRAERASLIAHGKPSKFKVALAITVIAAIVGFIVISLL
jgi:hypothetical protein